MRHASEHVERPGESQQASGRKKKDSIFKFHPPLPGFTDLAAESSLASQTFSLNLSSSLNSTFCLASQTLILNLDPQFTDL